MWQYIWLNVPAIALSPYRSSPMEQIQSFSSNYVSVQSWTTDSKTVFTYFRTFVIVFTPGLQKWIGVTPFYEIPHQTITELGWWPLWTWKTFSLASYEDPVHTLSFWRLNFSSDVKIFSSVNKIFLKSSFLYKLSSTFDISSPIRFKHTLRRCLAYFL